MISLYIDPSSGSVILNLFLSILFSIGYYFRELLYYKKGKKKSYKIALFSEGNNYHSTFYPIVNELINQKIDFIYYTLDINDKILDLNNKYLESRFIGLKFNRRVRFMNIESDYLISTTPNIGNKNYFLGRPKKVQKLAHVFHAISDLSYYKKGAFDSYDLIFLVGGFQIDSIETLYKKNNILNKKLLDVGLPYFDFYHEKNQSNKNILVNKKQILLAPSWGEKGFLKDINSELILSLSEYKIVIRPHPQSFISEKEQIINLKRIIKNQKNCTLDQSNDFFETLSFSNILVSDTSSIRFDFSFLFNRPVITVINDKADLSSYEFDNLKKTWDINKSRDIGEEISKNDLYNLSTLIKGIENFKNVSKVNRLKNSTISNIGTSAKTLVNYIK